jgi:hypothetical protein
MNASVLLAVVLGAPAPADTPPPGDEPAGTPALVAAEPMPPSEPLEEPEPEPEPAPSEPAFDPAADAMTSAGDDAAPPTEATAATKTEPPPTTPVPTKTHTYPELPIRWRLDIGAAGGSTFITDRGFFAFTPGRRHLVGFTLDVRADVPIGQGRLFLGGGLTYRRSGRADGIFEDALTTDLIVHDPMALGRVSLNPTDGVDFYAQLAAGPSIALVTTGTPEGLRTASQRRITGVGEAFGGMTLYLPKRLLPRKGSGRITGGLDLGLGYSFRGKIDIAPELDTPDDAISTTSVDLGDLALRGLVWRAGFFIRFM